MARRALPSALALSALVGDSSGHHAFALTLLLAAIPAAFVLVLECYGDAIEARCGRMRPIAAAAGLLLIVFSAALRSPAVVGGVPRVAVSALVLGVLFSLLVAAPSAVPARSRLSAPPSSETVRSEDERLAA
jgi:hypothetical protein